LDTIGATMPVAHAALQLDYVVDAWVVAHRARLLDGVMLGLSIIGEGARVWLALAVGLALARRLPWLGVARMIVAILCVLLVVDWMLKPAVGRARPFERTPVMHVLGPRPHDASFPSGHASGAGAGALALTMLAPWGWPLWWALAAAIGYSRVYLGDHYPLDVMAGGAIGAALAWIVMRNTSAWSGSRSWGRR
jgi:membrane-associated phospholipid phosphatase